MAVRRTLTPKYVTQALTSAGVRVNHVATKRAIPGDIVVLIVFLEASAGHHSIAQYHAGRLPGVIDVSFHPGTRSVMYIRAEISRNRRA